MTNATIIRSTMSDNSTSFEVAFADDQGHRVAILAAESEEHAYLIADTINNASWIQFYKT